MFKKSRNERWLAKLSHLFKGRTFQVSIWVASSNFLSQLLRFVSNLILTRLLAPDIFGLMATVNVLYLALIMLSDIGIWVSVIQSKRGGEVRFLGTAALMQIFHGLIIAIALICLSILLAFLNSHDFFQSNTAYADPLLAQIILSIAICGVIHGLESPKIALAQREMLGGPLARFELLSHGLTVLTTIALAWWLSSIWGLVLGAVIGSLIRTTLSHCYLPGILIRPCLDKNIALEVFKLGKWILLSSTLGFLAANGEKILLAGVFDKSTFGIFSIAFTILLAISTIYLMINSRVIFPRLSLAFRLGNPSEVRSLYIRVQKIADLLLGFITGCLFILGEMLIKFLYDDRYYDAGWMLQLLSLSLLAMRHQVFDQYMMACGQPQRMSVINFLRLFSLFIFIPIGFTSGGNQGAIIAVVLSQFASWPVSYYTKYQQDLLNCKSEMLWIYSLFFGIGIGLTFNYIHKLI